jgi:hypothetical protein
VPVLKRRRELYARCPDADPPLAKELDARLHYPDA